MNEIAIAYKLSLRNSVCASAEHRLAAWQLPRPVEAQSSSHAGEEILARAGLPLIRLYGSLNGLGAGGR